MKLLEVKNLTKRFGGLIANDKIDLELEEGEILGLIGPNGAGKTTLFNCVTGYYKPTSGSVFFEGKNITNNSPHEVCKKGIARTFQITQVFKKMTVLENVMVGGFLRKRGIKNVEKEATKVLKFVGLLDKKDLLGNSLSPPEQRKLEIAMALSTRPKIIMLDESMAGLNAAEIDIALNLIRQIRERGVSLIVIEHVMKAVMSISDRIIVLDSGKKIAEGTPEEIADNEKVIKAYLGERYRA